MEYVKQLDLFKFLSDKEIDSVINNIHYQRKFFNKDEMIVSAGTKCSNLKIILSGSAHTEMSNLGEKVIKIADIKRGQTIAIAFVFGTNNRIPVDLIADEKTEIIIFPKESINKMISLNIKILDAILEIISNQTQYLAKKIKFLNFNTIREKMIYFIREQQMVQNSDKIKLKLTQQKLAELFGVTRPSLARVIGDLENEGKIELMPNKIIWVKDLVN